MANLLELSEMEGDLVPEILPVDARISLSAQAHTLIELFSAACDVAPTKEVIVNTSFVLLEAKDSTKTVEVSATDGERAITVIGPAIVRLPGTALLPGKRMLDILKLVPENTVRIDVVGTTATIRSDRALWTVQTPPVDSYLPMFSSTDDFTLETLPREELLHALEAVLPAVAKSSARQSLMQAEVAKGVITSCDGVRAHRVPMPSLSKTFSTTLPLNFIESAIKSLKTSTRENVALGTNHSTVILHFGDSKLLTQRMSFEYPAVNHLVLGPALSNEEKLIVNRSDLMSTIKRVRVNADPEYFAIFLSIRQTSGIWTLIVRARDKNGNASQETLPAEYIGPATTKDIILNHRYLLDFLSCTAGEDIELRLGESTKAKHAPVYYESEEFVGSLQPMAPSFVR